MFTHQLRRTFPLQHFATRYRLTLEQLVLLVTSSLFFLWSTRGSALCSEASASYWGCLAVFRVLRLTDPLLADWSAVGLIFTMFLTEQQSSSRSKDKAPAERLTPLQEKESEIADLRRQVRDFRQENDEVRTKCEDLEAEQKAKNESIERLSNDLSRRELEIDSNKERNAQLQERIAQLQGLVQDLFQKRWQDLNEGFRASKERYQSDFADARKVMDKESGPVTLAASKTAETNEQANPLQLKQSSLDTLATELKSEKVLTASIDATDNESQMVKIKNEVAQAQVATEPPGELISSSDEEEEQKTDASVQTGSAAATSQTRGKYWPRGVL